MTIKLEEMSVEVWTSQRAKEQYYMALKAAQEAAKAAAEPYLREATLLAETHMRRELRVIVKGP